MFPQQVDDLYHPKAKPAAAPAAAATAAPAPAAAPAVAGSGKRLFVTVGGKRHQVTVETLN